MDGWTHEQKINDLERRLREVGAERDRLQNERENDRVALRRIADLGSEAAASRYGSEDQALIAAIEIAEQALKE